MELASSVVSTNGCTATVSGVVPGEFYVFKADARGEAKATAYPTLGGRKLEWWDEMGKIYAVPFGRPGPDGWCHAEALVRIPDGVDRYEFRIVPTIPGDEMPEVRGVSIRRVVWFDPAECP